VNYTDFRDKDEKDALGLWFFQLRCNGINLKDLLLLKWSHRMDNCFVITREKTKRTTRGNQQPIIIPITPKLESQLAEFGVKDSPYVLGFLKDGMTESQILDKRAKVAKELNKKLGIISQRLNLSVELKTKTTRDVYATYLRNKGVSLEIISNGLNHTSVNTTRHYLGAFDMSTIHSVNSLLP
jgi:integrase